MNGAYVYHHSRSKLAGDRSIPMSHPRQGRFSPVCFALATKYTADKLIQLKGRHDGTVLYLATGCDTEKNIHFRAALLVYDVLQHSVTIVIAVYEVTAAAIVTKLSFYRDSQKGYSSTTTMMEVQMYLEEK